MQTRRAAVNLVGQRGDEVDEDLVTRVGRGLKGTAALVLLSVANVVTRTVHGLAFWHFFFGLRFQNVLLCGVLQDLSRAGPELVLEVWTCVWVSRAGPVVPHSVRH